MTLSTNEADLGKDLPIGSRHYRAWVGSAEKYDRMSALQFTLLTSLGLREHHSLLDIGCGSLRVGRLFIPYLLPGRYCGIEPQYWLIEEVIANEIGHDIVRLKQPTFSDDANFTLSTFGREFDFILAQSIFSHASQAQIRRCLGEAKKVMKPTTLFVANYLEGEENYTGEEWVYPGLVPYTREHFQALVAEHGLVCRRTDWRSGSSLTWTAIVHPGHEGAVPETLDRP